LVSTENKWADCWPRSRKAVITSNTVKVCRSAFRTGITCELFSPEPDYTCWIQLKALVLHHEVAGTRYECIQKNYLSLARKVDGLS